MDEKVKQALAQDRIIDITTTGRKSGQAHRIEIWFHNVNGRLFISGLPGHRDWYANLVAHPDFTFHLKESVQADLPARAVPITEESQRRAIMSAIIQKLSGDYDLEKWVANSPLVKCAMHGNDPNWGRIVSAAGYANVPFDADKCVLTLQGTNVFRSGQPVPFDAALVVKNGSKTCSCSSGSIPVPVSCTDRRP